MRLGRKKNNRLEVGDRFPLFNLKDQDGVIWKSHEKILGKISIVFFYPKDNSSICTKEACAFSDSFAAFALAGAQVIGINSGSIESHKKFAQRNSLPFTLLSDSSNIVAGQFGVKNILFLTGRETFIFDRKGILIYKFSCFFNGEEHVQKVLDFLASKKYCFA